MPIVKSQYRAPFLYRNGHLGTIIPSTFRKVEGVNYNRERIETSDDDFLDLDWVFKGSDKLVIISHGLEGSSERPYVRGMVRHFTDNGWDALAWNCRSCSGELNRKPRFYHHGATEDIAQVIDHVDKKRSYTTIALVGFSMGGSMVLKYLGENGRRVPQSIIGGVAFSVPVSLKSSVEALSSPQNGFYRKRFLKKLTQKIEEKSKRFPDLISVNELKAIRHFPEFDTRYTAPLHGFKDAMDFYEQASAGNYMYGTTRQILLVNALNDPFLGEACYPIQECKTHPLISLEMPKQGGHVGFSLKKDNPNYMEIRAYEFVKELL